MAASKSDIIYETKRDAMKLNIDFVLNEKDAWAAAGVALPKFDIAAIPPTCEKPYGRFVPRRLAQLQQEKSNR